MIILYLLLILILIIIIILLLKKNELKNIYEGYDYKYISDIQSNLIHNNVDNFLPSHIKDLNTCQVPTLNTEQCYKSRYYECPIVNGSMLQCTNNYIPKPDVYNADCGNRTFDMVPYPWKISENCYYNKIDFNRKKEFDKVKFI